MLQIIKLFQDNYVFNILQGSLMAISHPCKVTLPNPRTLAHKSFFILRTSQLWSSLPSTKFHESYNLPSFKSNINKLDLISLYLGHVQTGTERNGTEWNDCVPTLFCVQTGTQSFHHTIVRPGLCHTLDRPFIFFIAQSA